MEKQLQLYVCQAASDYAIAKSITKDYEAWLGLDLCFQHIDKEYAHFETMYAPPEGSYIYATYQGSVAGGVGCRLQQASICEMKRLYVYENFRGKGIGKRLCEEIISLSKTLGYKKMRL